MNIEELLKNKTDKPLAHQRKKRERRHKLPISDMDFKISLQIIRVYYKQVRPIKSTI